MTVEKTTKKAPNQILVLGVALIGLAYFASLVFLFWPGFVQKLPLHIILSGVLCTMLVFGFRWPIYYGAVLGLTQNYDWSLLLAILYILPAALVDLAFLVLKLAEKFGKK